MRILFMGTPDFAVPSLCALADSHTVIGVVSQPDKQKGRGMQLRPTPVKAEALARNIPVFQPQTLKNDAFADELNRLAPDVIVVVAYGKILPPYLLYTPQYGCINLHGSLLPAYRGAAPMQRAIMDGCTCTGVTTMQMADGIDTGNMLEKATLPILPEDNFETVHDRLAKLGAELLCSTLKKLEAGELIPQVQDEALATYAAKIEKSDCLLNFEESASALHNRIRGLSPIPLAFTTLHGKLLKIVQAEVSHLSRPINADNGQVISLADGKIAVACGNGVIALTRVLPEGKARMSASDFINGRKIAIGDRLGKSEL